MVFDLLMVAVHFFHLPILYLGIRSCHCDSHTDIVTYCNLHSMSMWAVALRIRFFSGYTGTRY